MLRALFILSTIGLAGAPAAATTYSAKPAVSTTGQIIGRDIVWSCGPAACQGATDESRPAIICQSLAKKTGRIESFAADGRAFAAADLDRCNAAAKTKPESALAAQ